MDLGVCYYPEHWPEDEWANDAEAMANLGLRYVRLGEFAWSRIEPSRNEFHFAWLDRAIKLLNDVGLRVVLCTPTATPPKWLVDEHPDMLPVSPKNLRSRGFGSRRHYDFSNTFYRQECRRITKILAKRYGTNPGVVGWQTDNELCCHDTTHSASRGALDHFQTWCLNRYQSITELNKAWGNVFWSMEYRAFSDIELPFGTVTSPNPSHQLAFRRFSSDEVISFHELQIKEIRKYAVDQWITHNLIPFDHTQVDCYRLTDKLDFSSYDSYPLGRTHFLCAESSPRTAERFLRTGHPDISTFYFDQVRGLSKQGFWIMEQQPGAVNWAPNNPRPLPGMVKLWSFEALAHGANCVSYFRWRQVPFGPEQMHSGLLRVDRSEGPAIDEIKATRIDVRKLSKISEVQPNAQIALLADVHGQWITEIESQSRAYNYTNVMFQYYKTIRQLGLMVDFVEMRQDLNQYKLVLAPCLPIVNTQLVNQIEKATDTLFFSVHARVVNPRNSIYPAVCHPGHYRN